MQKNWAVVKAGLAFGGWANGSRLHAGLAVIHGLYVWGEVARKSNIQLEPTFGWKGKVQAGAPIPGWFLL